MARRERRPSWRDDRAWQAGILIGSALGAAATVVGRRMEQTAREGLVDWPAVERFAIGRLEGAPGALDAAELRSVEPAYAEAMARIVPALSTALGTELPGVVERDRKSTRLNSSHSQISYAVFCLKKKKKRKSVMNITKNKKKKKHQIQHEP